MSRPKLGLVLSGGGARGFVHAGILKALAQSGIPIDCIAGTSMGGVIAAAYASGYSPEEIEAISVEVSRPQALFRLLDITAHQHSLLEGSRIRDFLANLFIERSFESLRIPLALPAVDLVSGREVVFTSGMVLPAVLATVSVPGVFKPCEMGPYRLIDGGILNNLPVDQVRKMGADIVIAVEAQVNPQFEKPWQDLPERPKFPIPMPDFFLDFYRAELIMIAQLTEAKLKVYPADLVIRPPIPPEIDMFLSFNRAADLIQIGEECGKEAVPEIERLLDQ